MPAPHPPAEPDADAALAALRERGADALDPVRFRYLEALARRAAQHHGAVRRVLVERLVHAAAALAERAEAAPPPSIAAARVPRSAGALTALVAVLDRQASPRSEPGAAPAELRTARQFRSTWARLRIERQLSRSQASVPANPGPLNSQRLVLRALRQMQEISPACLARFMGHVEALMWLEQASLAAAPPRTEAAATPRRAGRAPRG